MTGDKGQSRAAVKGTAHFFWKEVVCVRDKKCIGRTNKLENRTNVQVIGKKKNIFKVRAETDDVCRLKFDISIQINIQSNLFNYFCISTFGSFYLLLINIIACICLSINATEILKQM